MGLNNDDLNDDDLYDDDLDDEKINKELLDIIENIMHNQYCNNNHYIGYVYTQLSKKLI